MYVNGFDFVGINDQAYIMSPLAWQHDMTTADYNFI